MEVRQFHRLARERVELRRLHVWIAVVAEVAVTLIIGEEQDDVGLSLGGCVNGGYGQQTNGGVSQTTNHGRIIARADGKWKLQSGLINLSASGKNI